MDLHMPGMDGITATQMIRDREKTDQVLPVNIIMLTADATDEARASAIEAGVDALLTKPIDIHALQAEIAVARQEDGTSSSRHGRKAS